MTDRERFILLLERRADLRGQLLPGKVIEVRERGDRAWVRLERPDPADRSTIPEPTSGAHLARRDVRWCLSFRGDPPPK